MIAPSSFRVSAARAAACAFFSKRLVFFTDWLGEAWGLR